MTQKFLLFFVAASSLAALIAMPLLWTYHHFYIYKSRKCDIGQLQSIPEKSILIAGHVYMETLIDGELFDPRLGRLLQRNRDNLEAVILTGDIFLEPSEQRWKPLKSYFSELDLDLFISPGNHDTDIGPSIYRELFKKEFSNPYVQPLPTKSNIILEDSTQSDGALKAELFDLVREQRSNVGHSAPIYIFRHHVPIKNMLGNSRHGLTTEADTIKNLQSSFVAPTVVVAGDGGSLMMPRVQCSKFKNLTIIVNGLGSSKDDVVLILNGDQIWTYAVNRYTH